ncbi:MAG: DUF362 domain-containing protein [Promethearchaeota archaeon]
MKHDPDRQCPYNEKQRKNRRRLVTMVLVALASAIWFVIRTGTKPSRVFYPCQQAALANISLFKTVASVSLPSIASLRASAGALKPVIIVAMLSVGGFIIATDPVIGFELLQVDSNLERVPIGLTPQTAISPEVASDLFYVQNATGPEGNMDASVSALIDLMAEHGLHFYNTSTTPDGLIGSDDVVLIKINSQWPRRGGTNTDLIKSVINAIHDHPDGFSGEVVIGDNGQGIGSMDYSNPNSYYQNQSTLAMADSFAPDWNVSTILWDDLHFSTVDDYNEGDFTDGYVRSTVWNEEMQLYTSYPKFQSPATGAYISFKHGIWHNDTGFDSNGLKILNMPVLKSHELLGVTSCVKHYMGVPQGYIVDSVSTEVPHEHYSVKLGGMGTMIAETRAPDLNILDMVWVNANPVESSDRRGPWSTYTSASATDIIGASVDPVALDYWSAKHVLVPTAQYLEYTEYSSLDPDYEPISEHIFYPYVQMEESFHNYLERSMNEMKDSGLPVTMDETEMNVFVQVISDAGPVTPTTPIVPGPLDYVPLVVGAFALLLVVGAIVVLKRRTS